MTMARFLAFKGRDPYYIGIAVLMIVFVILQVWFVWNGGAYGVFNSPDANANYYFASRLFEGEPLVYTFPFPESPELAYLTTRSTRVVGDSLIPVGFLGLIVLYGLISKALFINVIPYLTVFFAVAGIYFFYKICSLLFFQRTAFIAAVLLSVHPAWWYYTYASLFPNVLFSTLCILSVYAAVRLLLQPRKQWYVLLGTMLALALF